MKRIKLTALSLFLITGVILLLIGCGGASRHVHTYGDTIKENTIPATCAANGSYDEVIYCTDCDEEISRTRKITEKLKTHTEGEWITDTDPTCKTPGARHKECSECYAVVIEEIIENKDAHAPVTDPRVEPTDRTDGLTEGSHCLLCGKVLVSQERIPAIEMIYSESLTVNGTSISATLPHASDSLNFAEAIKASSGVEWILALDEQAAQPLTDKNVSLATGENRFFIHATSANEVKVYEVTIYRKHLYTVSFNTNGGSAVEDQTVEEGGFITPVTTSRDGYEFVGWDHDLTLPINQSITVNAGWTKNSDTSFTVNYYLENISGDGYDLELSEKLNGLTDESVTAEIKNFPHFTFLEEKSTVSGNINGNGSLVLEIYYSRNKYQIALDVSGATAVGAGVYPYGSEVTVSVECPIGYSFSGWISGAEIVCDDPVYTFEAVSHMHLTAAVSANEGTKYKVIYMLEGLDGEYLPQFTKILTGYTDSTVSAEIMSFPNYTFDEDASTLNATIDGSGSTVLYVYYQINRYTVTAPTGITVDGAGAHPYGATVTATVKSPMLGYEYIWYSNGEIVSRSEAYTFVIESDVELVCNLIKGMEIFNFTSTNTSCTLTGLKDKSVTDIVIPSCVTAIGTEAFQDCTEIKSVIVGDGVKSIGGGAFQRSTALERVVLGNNVTTLNNYAFRGCKNLKEISLGKSLETIGTHVFYQCESLQGITVPKSVSTIGARAFYECLGLSYVEFNGEMSSIGERAFFKCDSLYAIVIPDGISTINEETFAHCHNLYSVTLPSTLTGIGTKAFYNCENLAEVVNNSTLPIEEGSAEEYGFVAMNAQQIIKGKSKLFLIEKYVMLEKGENQLYLIGYLGNETVLILPDLFATEGRSYTIGYETFLRSKITALTLSDAVTEIEGRAFYSCASLTTVQIPASVTKIGIEAFNGCYALKNVTFGNTDGWSCTYGSRKVMIQSQSLSDPSTAATYLISNYRGYEWICEKP